MSKKKNMQDIDLLTVYHIHVFPDWLKDVVINNLEKKIDARQKKDLLKNIVAYLVQNNVFTQKEIASMAKCSSARISQIMTNGGKKSKRR